MEQQPFFNVCFSDHMNDHYGWATSHPLKEHLKLTDNQIAEYQDSLIAHIRYVYEAAAFIGIGGAVIQDHDQSKFGEDEFFAYAKHHKGGGAPEEFSKAWLHHIHNNPHHWNYWLFADGHSPKGTTVENGAVYMPIRYSMEMVADWMGASKAYTGDWDMMKWLFENMPRIRLHSKTADDVRGLSDSLGYADVLCGQRWAHEIE